MSARPLPAREPVSGREGRNPARAVRALGFALVMVLAPGSCGDGSPMDPDVRRPALVVLDPEVVELHAIGALFQIDALVLDAEGEPLAGIGLDWSADDPSVLESRGDGVFRTVGEGTARTTATVVFDANDGDANGQPPPSATALVTVIQRAARLDILPASLTLWALGQEAMLEAEAKDAEGTPMQIAGLAVSWSVGGDAPVAVDAEGRLTALGDGSTQVRATFEDATGEASVLVEATFSYSACVKAGALSIACAEVSVSARDGGN